jgi:dihydrodipicolinate synthase/N-acetylneuraminate lyase
MTVEQAKRRWKGPVVPVLTIFGEDLGLDLEGLRGNVQYLLDAGARVGNMVLLVCGAGGDFPVLTTEERKQVAETVAQQVGGRVPIIVGAEHTSTLTCVELARHAVEIGADAVQVCPPYYYTPSHDDIFHHFQVISDAVDIGIVVYNTWWTAPDIRVEGMERLASLDNVIGVKWSEPEPSAYMRGYDRLADRLAMIDNGVHHVYCHMQGGVGWISHVSNFWPQHDWAILELMEQGRYRQAQDKVNEFNAAFGAFRAEMEAQTGGEGHAIKKIMELVGLAGGPSRPPTRYVPMTDEQRTTLSGLLKDRIMTQR